MFLFFTLTWQDPSRREGKSIGIDKKIDPQSHQCDVMIILTTYILIYAYSIDLLTTNILNVQ